MKDFKSLAGMRQCLALAALIAFAPADCFAQEQRIRVGFSAMSGSMAWLWTAKEGGYFDQQGLKVDLVYVGGTAQLFQAMLAGEIAFGIGGGPAIINANAQRRSIVGVAGTLNRMVMKIMASPQIKSPADLRGKRIAVTRYGTTSDFSARLFLKNWAPAAEKGTVILQVGSIPNVLASLHSGTSQLGALSPPAHIQAERAGFTELMDLSKREIFYPYTYVTVTTGFLEKNSQLIRPFLAGAVEGIRRFKTDKAFAKRQIGIYLRVEDDKILEDTHQLFADLFETTPYIKREGVASLTQILAENDPKLESFKVDSIVEDRFVRELETSGFIKNLYR
ncbi:MAG: ABC transporter substrate-binding protein [Deltaproteobacteria bacterium]|nr:ABC transporter substrate-binding protein [Deltaproteobacteria bacterium]